MVKRLVPNLLLTLMLAGCVSIPTPAERTSHAQALASRSGWNMQRLDVLPFALAAFLPPATASAGDIDTLTIYLEDDGLAWIGTSRPSDDPTPNDPLALQLALAQPDGVAVYLGRPCQYVFTSGVCDSSQWTSHRFAPDSVVATGRAIDLLKQRYQARRLTLVGYSGGGALALLLANRRADVDRVVTVAGNLDHAAWTAHHHIDALRGSLNPADELPAQRRFQQIHLAGQQDRVMPPSLALAYAARYPVSSRPDVRVMAGFDHYCCWAQAWPRLWKELPGLP